MKKSNGQGYGQNVLGQHVHFEAMVGAGGRLKYLCIDHVVDESNLQVDIFIEIIRVLIFL